MGSWISAILKVLPLGHDENVQVEAEHATVACCSCVTVADTDSDDSRHSPKYHHRSK